MMNLKSLLEILDPATSIEILIMGEGSIYCGTLLNLSYCEIREMLGYGVDVIKMKSEEHGYHVLIIANPYSMTVSMGERA